MASLDCRDAPGKKKKSEMASLLREWEERWSQGTGLVIVWPWRQVKPGLWAKDPREISELS